MPHNEHQDKSRFTAVIQNKCVYKLLELKKNRLKIKYIGSKIIFNLQKNQIAITVMNNLITKAITQRRDIFLLF